MAVCAATIREFKFGGLITASPSVYRFVRENYLIRTANSAQETNMTATPCPASLLSVAGEINQHMLLPQRFEVFPL